MNTWQYNGVAPWHEIVVWCIENFYHGSESNSSWGTNNSDTFYFKDPKEYTLFLLRWS